MSNLNLDQVSPSQASKEATINLAIAELEQAMTEMVTYDLSANHVALLIDEQRATRLHCTGVPSGGTTLTLVPVKRAIIVSNGGTGTLSVVMGTTTVTVAPGIKQPVYCDGTANGIEAIGGAGALPSGGSAGQVLTLVSGVPTWAALPTDSDILSALSDVNVAEGPGINGYFLKFDNVSGKWVAAALTGGAGALSTLTDVNVTEGSAINGKFLKWDQATSKWIADTPSGGGGGSADTMFARAADIVKPTSSMFTLVQSASNAAMADTTRGVFFKFSGGVANHNMAIMRRAMPSTPYTIKAQAMALGNPFNYSGWGIAIADGSGKNSFFGLTGSTVTGSGSSASTGFRFDVQDASALGTYAADTAYENHGSTVSVLTPVWLRMQDDGTTLYYAWSNDGEHWRDIVSRSRTAYIASPAYIGIMLNIVLPDDTKDFGVHLFSYAELAGIV